MAARSSEFKRHPDPRPRGPLAAPTPPGQQTQIEGQDRRHRVLDRHRTKRDGRPGPGMCLGLRLLPVLGIGILAVTERGLITSSLGAFAHLRWIWLPLAVQLELVSISALARTQHRLLRAGDKAP